MKRKKILPVVLTGAMVLTSAAMPTAVSAAPEEKDLTDGLIAAYSFDDKTLNNSVSENDSASAITTGLKNYTGDPLYESGKEGQAVRLGDYGLKLNKENLGKNFTVSMWLQPDAALKDNQSVLFLGYHSPEKWLAAAGNASGQSKIWANGNGYSWTELGTTPLEAGKWHCLTVTGTGETVTAYLDGETVVSGKSNNPLDGTNQDIYLGVNNWDEEFTGLVDEVKVYNRALTAGEAYQLYDNRSPEEVLKDKGITVTKSLNMLLGRQETLQVDMPASVKEADPKISFESSDTQVVSVDVQGVVTALAYGEAEITTKVTLGNTTKSATTTVLVEGNLEESLAASYSFEGNTENQKGEGQALPITTGLKNYSGPVVYEEGKNGQAVRLGDYGLQLDQKNLGEEYTVSLWLKPDGTFAENQCLLFLGYHNPERWLAVSGERTGTNACKIWAKGGIFNTHTTLLSPEIASDGWHQLTLTGKKGTVSAYLDGIHIGTKESNDPLNGVNQDIYLGVNNWDPEFSGLMDEVKVYRTAMTESEVQNQAKDEFSKMLQDKLDSQLTVETLLGENKDSNHVKYDLVLPKEWKGMPIIWESSREDVLDQEGHVTNPDKDVEVQLTAIVSSGSIRAQKVFDFQVLKLDRTELDKLIRDAKAIDKTFLTDSSKERLEKAIEDAELADSYSKIDRAYDRLKKASTELYYVEEYADPFSYLADVQPQMTIKINETASVFAVSENVQDTVEVAYTSQNPEVAVYENGQLTAKKEGKTIVTAVVTSKYDGFSMEYATAVEVTEDASNPEEPQNPDPSEPGAGDGGTTPSHPDVNTSGSGVAGNKAAKTGDESPLAAVGLVLIATGAAGIIWKKRR